MENSPPTRILTVLAGNFLVIGAVGAFFLNWYNGYSISLSLLPGVAGILCYVAAFQKTQRIRAVLLLIAGFLPVLELATGGPDVRRYDRVANLLFNIQTNQSVLFWLVLSAGFSGMVIGAILRRESQKEKLSRFIALGGGITLLIALMLPMKLGQGYGDPMLFFPIEMFPYGFSIQGTTAIVMMLALLAAAVLSISWGFGIKKEMNYPKWILMTTLGAIGIMIAGMLVNSSSIPLRNYNYTNNLIEVWHLMLYLVAPAGFLFAKCVGLIALLRIKNPALPAVIPTPPRPPFAPLASLTGAGKFTNVCPCCKQETYSLKRYTYPSYLVFVGVYIAWLIESHVACPKCMRLDVMEKANNWMLTATILTPLVMFPWGIVLVLYSLVPGHSPSLNYDIRAQQRQAANAPQNPPQAPQNDTRRDHLTL